LSWKIEWDDGPTHCIRIVRAQWRIRAPIDPIRVLDTIWRIGTPISPIGIVDGIGIIGIAVKISKKCSVRGIDSWASSQRKRREDQHHKNY